MTKLTFLLSAFLFAASAFGSPIEHAQVSAYAIHIPTGRVLIDQNSSRSLVPSSALKIVTTAAALHMLGPESYFETKLSYDGILDHDGTLHGNLYIEGGGDPCLGSDRVKGSVSWRDLIEDWAIRTKQAGIQKIEGAVICDASKWEKALAVPSWLWEDLGNYYGAGASALSFHENFYTLFFKPGNTVGEKTKILRTEPSIPGIQFHNEVTTGPKESGDRACIYGIEFSPVQYLRGTIPAGIHEFSIKGAIPDPARTCAEILREQLENDGIKVEKLSLPEKKNRVHFYSTVSPKIEDIIHHCNQASINLYAEHLMKKVGEKKFGFGSTENGLLATQEFLRSLNIEMQGCHLEDGSGLSRKNFVTTKMLTTLLVKMKNSPYFEIFYRSLPTQTSVIHAKSGSMSFCKSYAGYAGDIAFAIIINQCFDQRALNDKMAEFFTELTDLNFAQINFNRSK